MECSLFNIHYNLMVYPSNIMEKKPLTICISINELWLKLFIWGSDGEVVRVFDSHFNVPGSFPGLVIGLFLNDFTI
jgi:hypothetical protein